MGIFKHFRLTVSTPRAAGAATISYGLFLNTVISFLIVAGAIFLLSSRMHASDLK